MICSLPSTCLTLLIVCSTIAAAEPSADQRKMAVNAREQRVALLRSEMKALDARIEDRVDALLVALRSIGDSKETRSKVARMKRDTIDRLQRTIGYYQQKRAAIQEELRRPTLNLTAEQKRSVIAKFDERIEKRVKQIIEIQQTLPGEKDYDRYKATGSGWWGTTYEINEDFRQNQRLTAQTNAQRDEIAAGLQTSIARIEQQNRALRASAGPAEEIGKNEELLAERRKQLAGALKPVTPPTRAVGAKEMGDIDKALKTAITDLRRDFDTLFARYNAAIQEVAALNTARAQLGAAKS
jgi:hypothetical protein